MACTQEDKSKMGSFEGDGGCTRHQIKPEIEIILLATWPSQGPPHGWGVETLDRAPTQSPFLPFRPSKRDTIPTSFFHFILFSFFGRRGSLILYLIPKNSFIVHAFLPFFSHFLADWVSYFVSNSKKNLHCVRFLSFFSIFSRKSTFFYI